MVYEYHFFSLRYTKEYLPYMIALFAMLVLTTIIGCSALLIISGNVGMMQSEHYDPTINLSYCEPDCSGLYIFLMQNLNGKAIIDNGSFMAMSFMHFLSILVLLSILAWYILMGYKVYMMWKNGNADQKKAVILTSICLTIFIIWMELFKGH